MNREKFGQECPSNRPRACGAEPAVRRCGEGAGGGRNAPRPRFVEGTDALVPETVGEKIGGLARSRAPWYVGIRSSPPRILRKPLPFPHRPIGFRRIRGGLERMPTY